MRKLLLLFCLQTFSASCFATTPVHVTLKAQSAVSANAEGFFSLSSIAALSGGSAAVRERMGAVSVGRAPLANEVRCLTSGDVALKLRQAGFRPETDAVIEGAPQVSVTVDTVQYPDAAPVDAKPPATMLGSDAASPLLVHRGDAVTIIVDGEGLSITAKGVARDAGRAGDLIHVHRDGVMSDLSVTVIDARDVELEL